ncbi:hypothetical protein [Sphingomonas sp. Mn802worker]|uniref:hypothetical protein n=1 Tax=Sphingomonas sp. Mn802worker TaxID=629773 RepID=UPI0003656F3A|nr:hypothetical protein [Sphingomonas sp. Mn802worker]
MTSGRVLNVGVAALLLMLAAYGVLSAPGLAAHWRAGLSADLAGMALFGVWLAFAGWSVTRLPQTTDARAWGVFAAGAIALRIAAAVLSDGRVSPGDPHWYLVLAQGLLDGHGLGLVEPYMGTRAVALFPPVYPLLLAGWGAMFGLSTAALLVLSSLLDLASASVIVLLARRLGAPRAGVAAACLFLVWPSQLLDAPLAQKESLATLLVLLLAYGWIVTTGRMREVVLIGVGSAALALTQPGEALLSLLFALLQWRRLGFARVMRIGAAAGSVALLAMLPWWWRNDALLHAFVPLTSAGGYSLWIGNNPAATGNWMPPPHALYGLPELAFSRAAGGLALDWIAAHPVDAIRLTLAKFVRAAAIGQAGLKRLAAMRPGLAPETGALLLPTLHGSYVLLLALAGAATMRLRGCGTSGRVAIGLVAMCFAQLLLLGAPFEFGERHRAFVVPFLLLAVALARERGGARVPTRRPAMPLRSGARATI